MRRLRILGACLLVILLLLSACGTAHPVETPGGALGGPQQPYDGEVSDKADSLFDLSKTDENAENDSVNQESFDAAPSGDSDERLPARGGYYYDLTNVVLYLEVYGELPPNYITKNEARALGWEGGSVEAYQEGAAIGGDFFGNYEGLLPTDDAQRYTECDIDTDGYSSRGSRRLVFSDDGRYFYTSDHYESFLEYRVSAEHEVIPCE